MTCGCSTAFRGAYTMRCGRHSVCGMTRGCENIAQELGVNYAQRVKQQVNHLTHIHSGQISTEPTIGFSQLHQQG